MQSRSLLWTPVGLGVSSVCRNEPDRWYRQTEKTIDNKNWCDPPSVFGLLSNDTLVSLQWKADGGDGKMGNDNETAREEEAKENVTVATGCSHFG